MNAWGEALSVCHWADPVAVVAPVDAVAAEAVDPAEAVAGAADAAKVSDTWNWTLNGQLP